jgi:hypothetical protein
LEDHGRRTRKEAVMAKIDDDDWEIRHTLIDWDIRRKGRAWKNRKEIEEKYYMAPDKNELIYGKLYGTDADRLTMLGLLLENCGVDAAVRMGDPEVWRAAVKGLEEG